MKVEYRWGKVETEFQWIKKPDDIVDEYINSNSLIFLANEARRLMVPYVPADNLMLAQNVDVYAEGDKGIVEYMSPHAHYQYIGKLYVSSITGSPYARNGEYKVPTGKNLEHSKFRHPLATSYWDKAMMTARKGDLAKAYQSYIRGGRT